MSRAFVKEPDGDSPEPLAELPLSDHPNYVTPRGLAQLRARWQATSARRDALKASADSIGRQDELARLERKLRWLNTRVHSAIEVDLLSQPQDRVTFGAAVTVASVEGEQRYRIVGEDEAAAEQQRVSYLSPLARALLERELRWLNARVHSAIEVDLLAQPEDRVTFGASVTVASAEGEQRYRIVGEDEAAAEQQRVSYHSPLARALLGARVGDEVIWQRPAGDLAIEVLAIDYADEIDS